MYDNVDNLLTKKLIDFINKDQEVKYVSKFEIYRCKCRKVYCPIGLHYIYASQHSKGMPEMCLT